ncbi:MAG: hypothetical protein Q7S82_00865 [bacterium]|nr:hypothetical protein [bacterium]
MPILPIPFGEIVSGFLVQPVQGSLIESGTGIIPASLDHVEVISNYRHSLLVSATVLFCHRRVKPEDCFEIPAPSFSNARQNANEHYRQRCKEN